MQQSLPPASPDVHGATSSTVKSLMEKNIIPIDTFVQTFLHTIMTGIEHRDSQVADAWVGCLLEVIPFLPLYVLQQDVTPVIIKKTLHEKPLFQRVSSCRIIGALCKKYPDAVLKRELLPVVLSLCQDVHADVRTEMTWQLPHVFQSLGSDIVEQLLMPLIVDLASEEITKVKEATFLAIVNSLPLYTATSMKTTIIPLLKQLFNFALNVDNILLLAITENYGRILREIERIEQTSDREYFTKYYLSIIEKATEKQRWLSKSDKATVQILTCLPADIAVVFRKYCASNYAAVIKFIYNGNNRTILDGLHRILRGLVSDHYWDVRKVVASSMSEILNSYGKYKLLLKDEYIRLLNDDIEDVLEGLLPQLAPALVDFARLDAFTIDQQNPLNSELLKALKHCEDILATSLNWRIQCSYIQQMEVMWYIFPTDIVHEKFIGVYLQKLFQTRVLPLRLSYIRTILINVKFSPNAMYRSEVKNKLCDLSINHSFYNRMLFIRSCYAIIDIYSTSYFKENFFMETIKLSNDPVPNIRWGVCKLLPQLRNMLKLPKDKHLMKALKVCVVQMESDSDNEVQIMLKSIKSSLDLPDEKAYPSDKVKEVEEKMLSSLNPKLIQLFPSSVMHMFDPLSSCSNFSVSSHQSLDKKMDSSSCIGKPNGVAVNISLSSDKPSNKDSGFSDKEFLVDAGVSLNTFDKISPNSNSCDTNKSIEKSRFQPNEDSTKQSKIVIENQSESKSPKKKAVFRQSIPVRKKSILPEPETIIFSKVSSESKQHPQIFERVKTRKVTVNDFEKRKSLIARRTEKRYSLDIMSTHKKSSFEVNLEEDVDGLVITDKEKNLLQVKHTNDPICGSVDINKNVTKSSTANITSDSCTVQRRKKSQLPRPLSCVVLPVKNNGLEKVHTPSKLPVFRMNTVLSDESRDKEMKYIEHIAEANGYSVDEVNRYILKLERDSLFNASDIRRKIQFTNKKSLNK